MFLFQKQLKRILLNQEFIMTELADVRAALKEAETTMHAAINTHVAHVAKPVASSSDLDGLILEIKKFTTETVAAVAALSPPVPEPAPAVAPVASPGAPFIAPAPASYVPPAVS